MLSGPKGSEIDSDEQCSVCGRIEELFDLPGRSDKYCLLCSADLATSMLLKTEIDEATSAGRSIEALEAEFREVGTRILGRSQSTEIGNG
jgi:hypothetical protein